MQNKFITNFTWELTKEYQDYENVLYGAEDMKPKYFAKHDGDITDTKEIFERVVKDFEIQDKDYQYLFKVLSNLSLNSLLNDEEDYRFLDFLSRYNFKVGINTEKFKLCN